MRVRVRASERASERAGRGRAGAREEASARRRGDEDGGKGKGGVRGGGYCPPPSNKSWISHHLSDGKGHRCPPFWELFLDFKSYGKEDFFFLRNAMCAKSKILMEE